MKAVFPVAGLGTRFLPATKVLPKEMLPIVDKPLIQYAVEEAYTAGIRLMVFITGRNKRAIEDHFDKVSELDEALRTKEDTELMALVDSIKPPDMTCVYIRQQVTLGLGHAVLCAAPIIGNDPFLVLLADDLMVGDPSASQQIIDIYARHQCSVLSTLQVAPEETQRYGIVAGTACETDLIRLESIVEKPAPADAPSRYAVMGRYVLMPEIFACIRAIKPGMGGELQLTDAIALLLKTQPVLSCTYPGRRYDCGSKIGFLQACVDLGMRHPQIGSAFSRWLEKKFS